VSQRPLRTVSGGALTAWAVAGLIGGWVLHPVAEWINGTAPVVTWLQPLALALVAAIVGGTAWFTWRTVHVRKERLESHRAVNRLVLGRACALAGAFLGGGYLGYAVSWLGIGGDPLAHVRLVRSLVAALMGGLICLGGVLLERACRISDDDPEAGGGAGAPSSP
jgi:hypothetical protein